MKYLALFLVLALLIATVSSARNFTKCKDKSCNPDRKCNQQAESRNNRKQVCGNDGKSYALSCIACAQNCKNGRFQWKDGVC